MWTHFNETRLGSHPRHFSQSEKVSQQYLQKSLGGQLHKQLSTLREFRRQKIQSRLDLEVIFKNIANGIFFFS